jgi:fatty acid desaturase
MYFFIAAGFFLIILAVLYAIGKKQKTPGEFASIAVRVFAGIGLTMACLAQWYSVGDASVYFIMGPWPIPMTMLAFFVVIVLDNSLVWWSNRRAGLQGRQQRSKALAREDEV